MGKISSVGIMSMRKSDVAAGILMAPVYVDTVLKDAYLLKPLFLPTPGRGLIFFVWRIRVRRLLFLLLRDL